MGCRCYTSDSPSVNHLNLQIKIECASYLQRIINNMVPFLQKSMDSTQSSMGYLFFQKSIGYQCYTSDSPSVNHLNVQIQFECASHLQRIDSNMVPDPESDGSTSVLHVQIEYVCDREVELLVEGGSTENHVIKWQWNAPTISSHTGSVHRQQQDLLISSIGIWRFCFWWKY